MADVLSFDLELDHPGFELRAAAEVPLRGITVISGASGSGKTTLLRALAGLEPGVRGPVRFGAEDWTGRPPKDRLVGFVFQDARLFRHLNVEGNLRYGAARRGTSEAVVQEVIDAFDLAPLLPRRTSALSGGEARRVALARAMASQPRILFLDEPMVGLDPARRAEVLPYITRAVDNFDLSVLYVSHSQFEMALLADRVYRMASGQLGSLQDGPPRFLLPVVAAAAGQMSFEIDGHRFTLQGDAAPGETWEIRPGHGCILSSEHPGRNTAAAVLPVTCLGADEAGRNQKVGIAGQSMDMEPAGGFEAGEKLWLICPRLRARHRGRSRHSPVTNRG